MNDNNDRKISLDELNNLITQDF